MRSITFVLEEVEDDARCEKIVSQIREGLAAEGNALSAKILEATALIDKATTAAETAARLSHQVPKDAAAAVQTIQTVSPTVSTSATQLSETSTKYRDAVMKASATAQHTPTGTATLDVRVRAREGVKQRQVLVDAANMGERILPDLNDADLALKANEIIRGMDAGGERAIVSARRLANGGILLELNTEEAARWLNEAGHRIQFTGALAPDVRMKARVRIVILHCSHPVTAGLQYIWTHYIVSAWELPRQFPESSYTHIVTTYYPAIPHIGRIQYSLVISEYKRPLTSYLSVCARERSQMTTTEEDTTN
jgi:ribosomal protein S26